MLNQYNPTIFQISTFHIFFYLKIALIYFFLQEFHTFTYLKQIFFSLTYSLDLIFYPVYMTNEICLRTSQPGLRPIYAFTRVNYKNDPLQQVPQ